MAERSRPWPSMLYAVSASNSTTMTCRCNSVSRRRLVDAARRRIIHDVEHFRDGGLQTIPTVLWIEVRASRGELAGRVPDVHRAVGGRFGANASHDCVDVAPPGLVFTVVAVGLPEPVGPGRRNRNG